MTVREFFASGRLARCPACGEEEDSAGWGDPEGWQHVRSYSCGAAFQREGEFISVRDICPVPSHIASAGLRAEAERAGA